MARLRPLGHPSPSAQLPRSIRGQEYPAGMSPSRGAQSATLPSAAQRENRSESLRVNDISGSTSSSSCHGHVRNSTDRVTSLFPHGDSGTLFYQNMTVDPPN